MSIPTQPETVFTTPDETPLWSYGFEWSLLQAFAVKRKCKKEGGKIWPPLEDDVDVDRDPDPSLAAKQRQETGESDEMSRAVDILQWSRLFLQNKTRDYTLFDNEVTVHTGVTGTQGRISYVLEIADARAWTLADIDMEAVQEEWEFPDENVMAILRHYLGEPRWFLEKDYVARNKLFPALESGAFQAIVGIVDSHPTDNGVHWAQSVESPAHEAS